MMDASEQEAQDTGYKHGRINKKIHPYSDLNTRFSGHLYAAYIRGHNLGKIDYQKGIEQTVKGFPDTR